MADLTWQINVRRNYARTDWDRTLSYVQSYVYQLPAGKGQEVADQRAGRVGAGELAALRHADPHDGNTVVRSPPAAAV